MTDNDDFVGIAGEENEPPPSKRPIPNIKYGAANIRLDVLVNHAAKYAVESNEDSFLKDASKSMLTKLEKYRTVLLKEPALIANYLDPRFPKPSNPLKFEELKAMIRK